MEQAQALGFIEHSVLPPSAAGVLPNSLPDSILRVSQESTLAFEVIFTSLSLPP